MFKGYLRWNTSQSPPKPMGMPAFNKVIMKAAVRKESHLHPIYYIYESCIVRKGSQFARIVQRDLVYYMKTLNAGQRSKRGRTYSSPFCAFAHDYPIVRGMYYSSCLSSLVVFEVHGWFHTSRNLKVYHPSSVVVILDKEARSGNHAPSDTVRFRKLIKAPYSAPSPHSPPSRAYYPFP